MKKTFLIILINFFFLNAFSQKCDSLFSYPTEGPSSLQCLENIMFTEDGGWGFLLTAGVEDSTPVLLLTVAGELEFISDTDTLHFYSGDSIIYSATFNNGGLMKNKGIIIIDEVNAHLLKVLTKLYLTKISLTREYFEPISYPIVDSHQALMVQYARCLLRYLP